MNRPPQVQVPGAVVNTVPQSPSCPSLRYKFRTNSHEVHQPRQSFEIGQQASSLLNLQECNPAMAECAPYTLHAMHATLTELDDECRLAIGALASVR